jgi:hypothetical protein
MPIARSRETPGLAPHSLVSWLNVWLWTITMVGALVALRCR